MVDVERKERRKEIKGELTICWDEGKAIQKKENDNALSITSQFKVFFRKTLMKIFSLVSCINPE